MVAVLDIIDDDTLPTAAEKSRAISTKVRIPLESVDEYVADAEERIKKLLATAAKKDDATLSDFDVDGSDVLREAGLVLLTDVESRDRAGTLDKFFNDKGLGSLAVKVHWALSAFIIMRNNR